MPLFGHNDHDEAWRALQHGIPGFAQVAAGQGWQPAGERPFSGHLEDPVHEIMRCMYGVPRAGPTAGFQVAPTFYTDACRGTISGRTVVVANAWTGIGPNLPFGLSGMKGAAVCGIELGGMLPVACIQPRQIPPVFRLLLASPTGDPAFDERFLVNKSEPDALRMVLPGMARAADMLTAGIRQQIMAHDDWVFLSSEYWLGCIAREPFRTVDAVSQRISEVLGILAAIPASIVPDHIDHSADDVVARFARLGDVDDAIAALQTLTDGERDQLRRSDTPLAAFADVRTPLEAMARFQELGVQERAQLLAMFQRAGGG
ncbi:MAG TPA: hypothetical protein VGG35_05605 [Streptosporangiaceae bacterium]|jgi:hypothetical protein